MTVCLIFHLQSPPVIRLLTVTYFCSLLDIVLVEKKGLVPTLTELLQDTSQDPFVLRAARTLIGRVSDRADNIPGVHDSTMNVA